jgi:hypothetical protein
MQILGGASRPTSCSKCGRQVTPKDWHDDLSRQVSGDQYKGQCIGCGWIGTVAKSELDLIKDALTCPK